MKKFIILAFILTGTITASCQNNKDILSFFSSIQKDTIICTAQLERIYHKMGNKNILPDSIALKYFFDNDKEKMQGIFEGYNVDDNTYTYTSYTKKVYPLCQWKNQNNYLLIYGIESILYLAFYNYDEGKIINNIIISDFSDDMGNVLTHSVLFPNNYFITIETAEKTKAKLIEIDYINERFIEYKNIQSSDLLYVEDIYSQNAKYQQVLELVGISKDGELITSTQE